MATEPLAVPGADEGGVERPIDRVEQQERAVLMRLAPRPYHSLALPAEPKPKRSRRLPSGSVPQVRFERRPLTEYDGAFNFPGAPVL